ncbi:hypothetical protein M0C34_04025 [Agarivorans sp. TSD2052]|uniref:hypothetical protein n=1 Tax=Agarivorans sp. TSD2052 TaxID=2937286 RepID=UPI00200DB906|nr:hypothetical protein [Agarivorans sp. TSD2052]UPW19456.1 hypothetical protein M0C34_04025 [Agarivorans sp. TSD2052]
MKTNKAVIAVSLAVALSTSFVQAEAELQDMSDPLAIYTQFGLGYTDKGLNLKVGESYDTGNPDTMAMNVLEVKGFAGDMLGWSNRDTDDSIDSIRYRNFNVDMVNGRGGQVDVNLGFTDTGTQGTASYSLIQALPKMGPVNLYPLVGLGVAFGESFDTERQGDLQAQNRWDLHGTFYVAGLYGKLEITDKIWLNYNPMYMGALTGSDAFKQSGIQGDDTMLHHEAALSYQINDRTNVRYFANWTEQTNYTNGDHRIEVNYQF